MKARDGEGWCGELDEVRLTEPSPIWRVTPAKLEQLHNGPAGGDGQCRNRVSFLWTNHPATPGHLFSLSELTMTALPCVITRGYARPRMLGIDRRRASLRAKFGSSQAGLTPLATEDGRARARERPFPLLLCATRLFFLDVQLYM